MSRIIISLPEERIKALDGLVARGAASSRNELIDKILTGFLKDLEKSGRNEQKTPPESALGALITFFLVILGAAAIAEIFGGDN